MSKRKVIHTDKAPRAIAQYSQAVVANGFVFCAGQIAIDPATGKVIHGDVKAQTRQAMDNLVAVLTAAGVGIGDVVKTTIFLADMNDYAAVNDVYVEYFNQSPPARSAIAASGLPRGVVVEIDAIAIAAP